MKEQKRNYLEYLNVKRGDIMDMRGLKEFEYLIKKILFQSLIRKNYYIKYFKIRGKNQN